MDRARSSDPTVKVELSVLIRVPLLKIGSCAEQYLALVSGSPPVRYPDVQHSDFFSSTLGGETFALRLVDSGNWRNTEFYLESSSKP